MLKAKDLRDQSPEELEANLVDLSKELFQLKNQFKLTKKLEQPHRLRELRRDRARILTVLGEKNAPVVTKL